MKKLSLGVPKWDPAEGAAQGAEASVERFVFFVPRIEPFNILNKSHGRH